MEMIEAGQVANLIVKDASHLGREYLQVGYYMEILFTHAFVVGFQSEKYTWHKSQEGNKIGKDETDAGER